MSTSELIRSHGQDLFRKLFDDSADAVLILDGNQFVDGNRAALEMLRMESKEQLRDTHPAELSPEFQPDGRPSGEKADEMIAIAVEKGSNRFEWIHRRADGEDFMVEVLLTPIEQDDRHIIHTVWREIGDRKKAEANLRQSEERFRRLFEDSADAALILDENQFVDGNRAALQMLRMESKEQLRNTHPAELSPEFQPDGRPSGEKADEMIAIALENGSNRFEWVHRRADGEDFPVEVLLTPIEHGDRHIIHTVWRDISERLRLGEARIALADAEKQTQRLVALHQMSEQLALADDTEEIFRVAAQHTPKIVQADRTSVALLNPSGDQLEVLALEGEAGAIPLGMQLPVEGTAIGKVVQENQSMIFELSPESPLKDLATLAEQGLKTTMSAPLTVGRRTIGTLNVGNTTPEAYHHNDQRLLLQAASLLASMLENRRLFNQIERRAVWLQTAAEVSRAASTILDPTELTTQVVNLIHTRFDLYYAGLFLVDELGQWTDAPGKWAVLRVGTGQAGEEMVARGHKLEIGGESMIGNCIQSGKPRIALDVGEEAVRFENPLLPNTRTELALPLISRGQPIGALSIQSDKEAAFSQEDIAVLQSMADQVATTIDNANLIERAQKRAERERLVRTVTDRVRRGSDTEAIMRITLQELGKLLNASKSVIRLGSQEKLASVSPAQLADSDNNQTHANE